jgi:hypothetical protein
MKNSFVSQSMPRPNTDMIKKNKKHKTKVHINLHHKNDSLNNSVLGIEKIEKNLKLIDSLLANDP